ncbi:odorant receptor 131-2-like [Aplochiton taeniatus]
MSGNTTQVKINVTVVLPLDLEEVNFYRFFTVSSCVIFLYINGVMLFTLRSKPVFRETPRYILLLNLLFGDTFQLTVSFVMYLLATLRLQLLRSVCAILTAFGIVTADISSLTLAVMSLERYVAVCFPLRAATIVTIRGTGVAIAVVWGICSANTLIRFIILFLFNSTPMNVLLKDFCTKEQVFLLKALSDYDEAFTCFVFVSVGVILILSYFGVMVAARSASSDKASTSKARKTVLLHLIQLCLSLSATRQHY